MSIEIKVPSLGESVTEASIAKWYKKPGDFVKLDDLLVELETDKVTLEVNALASGIIESIDVVEGKTVVIDEVIGKIKEGDVADMKIAAVPEEKKQDATTDNKILSPAASNCTDCAVGKFSDIVAQPFPCKICPAGW